MSGRSSRNKGASGEREVSNIFKAAGYTTHRTPLSGGMQWRGDVQGVPGYHLEIKRAERLCIPQWIAQAESDCPDGCVPLVVYRSSRQPWRVIQPLTNFIEMLSA